MGAPPRPRLRITSTPPGLDHRRQLQREHRCNPYVGAFHAPSMFRSEPLPTSPSSSRLPKNSRASPYVGNFRHAPNLSSSKQENSLGLKDLFGAAPTVPASKPVLTQMQISREVSTCLIRCIASPSHTTLSRPPRNDSNSATWPSPIWTRFRPPSTGKIRILTVSRLVQSASRSSVRTMSCGCFIAVISSTEDVLTDGCWAQTRGRRAIRTLARFASSTPDSQLMTSPKRASCELARCSWAEKKRHNQETPQWTRNVALLQIVTAHVHPLAEHCPQSPRWHPRRHGEQRMPRATQVAAIRRLVDLCCIH